VRLGYAVYSDALQHSLALSGSGAGDEFLTCILQYNGLSSTKTVFSSLCSDGLSDYDRVEQCWETEILPILDGIDVAAAGARLVEIATQNGHDNVTVGLVYCQVSSFEPKSTISASSLL